jgi:hypothetical protein
MITPTFVQLLIDSGFDDGWALSEETLVLWEHEQEPPAPLVRPKMDEPVDDLVEGEQP